LRDAVTYMADGMCETSHTSRRTSERGGAIEQSSAAEATRENDEDDMEAMWARELRRRKNSANAHRGGVRKDPVWRDRHAQCSTWIGTILKIF